MQIKAIKCWLWWRQQDERGIFGAILFSPPTNKKNTLYKNIFIFQQKKKTEWNSVWHIWQL